MMSEISLDLLSNLKKSRSILSIRRDNIDSHRIQGFLLDYSDEIILLQYISDFRMDGLMILKRSDITEIESDKTDSFQTQILKDDGIFDKIQFNTVYKVDNLHCFFLSLKKINEKELVILENETSDPPIFCLGRVEMIGRKSISIKSFSGRAKWKEESEIFDFNDINSVQIQSSYIKGYQRYFDRNPDSWI
ncbi:MAG: hypothetical protein JJ892_13235 [Balneola sp.]|nr:hypothetical protein [Balneola sp.]MBO6649596.1 hypothetical protein [Balneola sp.]MBO6711413.1 hypothetical protein [Balneola sp.]MBO6801233.1 hypothetical protein [Balneola sp.]MBO6869349.1 hypothetical protein [Balneola sp.]